mmetsp:Transcript_5939/g.8795  ORF Transcript_5939/g.8795 Transcript_5939/m.8795 type:complete len:205 (-) Transcript_5939:1347-1961(-)
MPFLNTVAFLSIVMLSLTTSNNSYASRGIFQTPIFAQDECTRLIKAALQTASRNAASLTDVEKRQGRDKGILEGWHSSRHNKYPTTDLSVIDDAFTMEDRLLVEEKLNDRLVPIVERLYGVVPKALHCSDVSLFSFFFGCVCGLCLFVSNFSAMNTSRYFFCMCSFLLCISSYSLCAMTPMTLLSVKHPSTHIPTLLTSPSTYY